MKLEHKDISLPQVPCGGSVDIPFYDTTGKRILRDFSNVRWKTRWADITNEWKATAKEYENNPTDFYHAWNYLDHHPMFWKFRHGTQDPKPLPLTERLHVRHLDGEGGIHRCVSISVVKVNAETRHAEDEPGPAATSQTEVWIELGKCSWPVKHNPKDHSTYDSPIHDYLLDCGGPTVETAIIRAAFNVWAVHGNDRRVCDGPFDKGRYAAVMEPEELNRLLEEIGDDGSINTEVQRRAEELGRILAEIERNR